MRCGIRGAAKIARCGGRPSGGLVVIGRGKKIFRPQLAGGVPQERFDQPVSRLLLPEFDAAKSGFGCAYGVRQFDEGQAMPEAIFPDETHRLCLR